MQLLRLREAFDHADAAYVTVNEAYRSEVPGQRFYAIKDATRWNKLGLVQMALQLVRIIWRERPEVIISTGAAPGFVAIRIGRLMGARTIWVDSIANVERLSLSGQKIGAHVDLWLTQWAHLARPDGPRFVGAVV